MTSILLKPGREKSLLRRHPWVFSGAIQRVDGEPEPGATVDVLSAGGEFLARAAWSPASQIRARVWSFDPAEHIDAEFLRGRIRAAARSREIWKPERNTDAYRLIYAESDGLPGLIVDRYGDVLVLQSLTAGSELWKGTIGDLLVEETGVEAIYERSEADVRELEGLPPISGRLRGHAPAALTIRENGLRYRVDLQGDQQDDGGDEHTARNGLAGAADHGWLPPQ